MSFGTSMTWRVSLIKLQRDTGFIEPLQQRQRCSIQLFLQGLCMHSKVHVGCQWSTGGRGEPSTFWLWMTERTMSNAIKSHHGVRPMLHTKLGSNISEALILWEILRFQEAWTTCYWVLYFFHLCGWGDSSRVKNTNWSSRRPGFDSQNSHGGSQTSLLQLQGIHYPLMASADTTYACGTQAYLQTKHWYT